MFLTLDLDENSYLFQLFFPKSSLFFLLLVTCCLPYLVVAAVVLVVVVYRLRALSHLDDQNWVLQYFVQCLR